MLGLTAAAHCVEVVGVVHEADLDAQLGQGVVEEVVGPPVQRGRRHEVVAGLGQGQYGQGLGRLAAGQGQGADAAFERRPPVLRAPAGSGS